MKQFARSSVIALCLCVALTGCNRSAEKPSLDPTRSAVQGSARSALLIAEVAAKTWATDAKLLYVENDAEVSPAGIAPAWGFLFYSARENAWRNVAVRGESLADIAPLGFPFAAPPLPNEWIDSEVALGVAEAAGGREFRDDAQAAVSHAVLSRGVFNAVDGAPTWTVVYRSAAQGELAIVVDAIDGSVLSKFEG